MFILLLLVVVLFAQFTVLGGYKTSLVEYFYYHGQSEENSELWANTIWNIAAIAPISIYIGYLLG